MMFLLTGWGNTWELLVSYSWHRYKSNRQKNISFAYEYKPHFIEILVFLIDRSKWVWMIPYVFMVYCFAFEIGQQNHSKENGKARFSSDPGRYLWSDKGVHVPSDVGHIHRYLQHTLLSTTVMHFNYFSSMLDYGSKNTRNNWDQLNQLLS